jgi:hypothetical protein
MAELEKEEITLIWNQLITINELPYNVQEGSGIYVWGFSISEPFIPYYVGIALNINFRIYEHINSIIGGKYTIYHKNSLPNFPEFKNKEIQVDKTNGKIYSPNWPSDYKNFINNRKVLQPHIDFMIDHFAYSYATIEDYHKCSKDIEMICINKIGKENLANTRAGNSNKFKIEHIGNSSVIEVFNKATNR